MISGPNGIFICDECISVSVDAMLTDTATGLQNCAYVAGSLQTTGTVIPPATSALTYANLSGTGVKIPSMASGSTLSFRIQCDVP